MISVDGCESVLVAYLVVVVLYIFYIFYKTQTETVMCLGSSSLLPVYLNI